MEISLDSFKRLLHSLKTQDIGLKVQSHSGWSNDYLHIIGFIASVHDQKDKTFGGVVLSNLAETEGVMINNISTILAFEIEKHCDVYEPHIVYTLQGSASMKALIID
jgi:hypothetical protein